MIGWRRGCSNAAPLNSILRRRKSQLTRAHRRAACRDCPPPPPAAGRLRHSWCVLAAGSTEATVEACGLAVVAWLAHRLPVGAVPEQGHIPAMRDDVVDHSRRQYAAQRLALVALAQRVRSQIGRTSFAPRAGIAALGTARVDLLPVLCQVQGAKGKGRPCY